MSEKCELCNGTGRIYTDMGFGYTVQPCPNCNKAFRKHMDSLTRMPDKAREKAAQ